MRANPTVKVRATSAFSEHGPNPTLRLLLERQHRIEIGERIRALRENSEQTNRSIADFCDVGERTVAGWVAGEGISYKNAVKVADLFDVDPDWLWLGDRPGPGPGEDYAERLKRVEGKLDRLLTQIAELDGKR